MARNPSNPRIVSKKHVARKQQEERQIKTAVTVTVVVLAVVVVLLGYVLVDRFIIKPNTVVARVGETELKAAEFVSNTKYSRLNMLNQINQFLQFGDMGKQYALPVALQLRDPEIVGENVLNQMIDEVIIAEKAAELGITVSDEEVEALMREQFNFFPDGTLTPTITSTLVNTPTWSAAQFELINPTATFTPSPEPTATPDGWEPTPADLPEGETPVVEETENDETEPEEEPTPTSIPTNTPTPTPYTSQLYKKDVKNYLDYLGTYEISRADIERVLKNGLLRDKLIAELTKDLPPTEEQVWVRHILVDGIDQAEEVIAKLKAGESWADLAAEYSTDLANKDNGGDLGWIGRIDSYDPPFLEAAFALNEDGEISEPVQGANGWHVIQLVTKAVNNVNSYKFDRIKQEYFNDWLTEQREARDDIKIEDIWKEFAPSVPPLPDEIYEYLITNPT